MAPVSWKLIQHGWPVFSSDGQQIGLVFLVVGDEDADILDGLAVTQHRGFAFHNFVDRPHYLEASKVAAIDDGGRVTASISAAEARALPVHDPPESAVIEPEQASLIDRARTAIERMTGGDHTN
jgi:hypothetical protein